MTKSTITREQLLEIIETDHVQCGEASYLARMALAAMDSEPVGEFYEDGPLNWYQISDGDRVPADRRIPLYRHAQPAPVVPDGYVMVPKEPTAEMILSAMRDNETGEVAEIYELMLAAAPQSPGSEPATVPGKWIPVSERMPDDDDFVYIWPRPDFGVELHVGQYCECSPKGDGWYAQVYEQNYGIEWYPITVTHWMPPPAAPQEVKGE